MPTIIKAFILCNSSQEQALAAVTRALGGACFEAASPVEDYAIGVAGTVPPSVSALDGQMGGLMPGAAGCQTSSELAQAGP